MSETEIPQRDFTDQELSSALDKFSAIEPCLTEEVTLAEAARQHGVTPRTIERWISAYKREGFRGLVRRRRSDRGKHHLPEELQSFIEGLALQRPRRKVTRIHEMACEVADREGWKPPGYRLVYNIVREIDPALWTLAHQGVAAYEQAYDLVYRREAGSRNEIWQADHTELDVWVIDDKGKPKKPWLTIIEDDYSRALPGYYLGFENPSVVRTSLALKQAIWYKADPGWRVCGIPDVFYTDHGADFISKHLEQVAAELSMVLIFCTAGKPRGKGKVERIFETVSEMFESKMPGWAPEGKPDKDEQLLTLRQLDERFHQWLVEVYHHRIHSETGQPPLERWSASDELPWMPDSEEQLNLLLLTATEDRKIHNDGIRFLGHRYIDEALAPYVGRYVVLRYDPRNVTTVQVYLEGDFLCRAVCPALAGQKSVSLKDLAHARRERRLQLRSEERERKEAVAKLMPLRGGQQPRGDQEESKPSAKDAGKGRINRWRNE